MKLHPNGSIEGTPEELHQYTKMQEKKPLFKHIKPNITSGKIDINYPGSGVIYVGTSPFIARYVEDFMSAIKKRGNLH